MASAIATKRLTRELKSLLKNPLQSPKITAQPNESNILEWYYVLEGDSDPTSPYHGGIYFGKLLFPKEYPYKPPGVLMLTPNGRFKPNRRLCLSMSDFHPESWNPMWSISTILTGLYSFMVEKTPTTGSVETSDDTKRKLAKESLDWNVREKMFCNLFPEYVEMWKEREEARKRMEAEALARGEVVEKKKVMANNSEGGMLGEGQAVVWQFVGGIVVAIMSILFAIRFI
jgi:ubiquitin-conjugating enzyme E2 J2